MAKPAVKTKKYKELKNMPFSKPVLIGFAVFFALLGGYAIYRSFAAGGTLAGDTNNDGVVNLTDLTNLLANWHTSNSACDFNSDGSVDGIDLSTLLSHYGQTATQQLPAIPTGLTAIPGDSSVTLHWNANPGSDNVDTYQVYVNDSNTPPSNLSVSGTSYTISGLTNGTSYNFRVSAHNSFGYGDWTSAASSTPTGSGTILGVGTLMWGSHYQSQTNIDKYSIFGISGGNESQGQNYPGKALGYVATNLSKSAFVGVNYSTAQGTDMILYCSDGSEALWTNFSQVLTNVGNSAYQQAFITQTAQYISGNHLKGVFIDNGGMQSISEAAPKCASNGAAANYPLYDSHHNVVMNSDTDWQNALASFYSVVGPALKNQGYYLMANGCTIDNDGSITKAWIARYYQYVSGIGCEYYMETPGAPQSYRSTGASAWYQNWDGWETNIEDYVQSLGLDFFGIEDSTPSTANCIDPQNERYTRASFLMEWNGTGNSAWLWAPLDDGGCDFWNQVSAINTGLPSGARFQLAPGVWQRNFANSTVVINTNTTQVTVTSNGQSLTIPALDASFK